MFNKSKIYSHLNFKRKEIVIRQFSKFCIIFMTAVFCLISNSCETEAGGSENITFTVIFNSNGHGTAPAIQNIASGGTVVEPKAPSCDGFIFNGWFCEKECKTAWDFKKNTVSKNITLWAKWEQVQNIKTFAVTFNSNGHGSNVEVQYVSDGEKIIAPDLTDDGWILTGWFSDESFENEWDFENAFVTEDLTLWAKWEKTFTVTFNLNFIGTPIPSAKITEGSKLSVPESQRVNGYYIASWCFDADCTREWNFDVNTVTSDVTLYANWQKIAVEKIILSSANLSLVADDAPYVISAIVEPSDAFDKTVTWSISSGSQFISIQTNEDGTCRVSGLSNGSATIAITSGKVREYCSVEVSPAPVQVSSVLFSPSMPFEVECETSLNLANYLIISPSDATSPKVEWSVSDTQIASVNNAGVMTVKSNGNVTVSVLVTSHNGTKFTAEKTIFSYYAYNVEFNMGGYGTQIEAQKVPEGKCVTKPLDPYIDGYAFFGWYADSNFTDKWNFSAPVTKDTTLFAKWEEGYLVNSSNVAQIISKMTKSGKIIYQGDITDDIIMSIRYSIRGLKSGIFIDLDLSEATNLYEIPEFAFKDCSNLISITIPNGVTTIGDSAFSNCSNLINITIPDTVTTIEFMAFQCCFNLSSLIIPDSVTTIKYNAFERCTRLTSIIIPNGVTTIEGHTFYNCSSLTSIIIPDSVTTIEHSAFEGCSNLTSVTIPDGVTTIGPSAFYGCTGLTSITIPDSIASIGQQAFYNCLNLTGVITIPEGQTTIGISTFYNCSSLTRIIIPDSITTIGSSAFYNCTGLKRLAIPTGVTNIYSDAFYNVNKVYYNGNSPLRGNGSNWGAKNLIRGIVENDLVFADSQKNTVIGYAGYGGDVIIPATVTTITEGAFNDCSEIEEITIPFVGGSANETEVSRKTFFGYIFGTKSYIGGIEIKQRNSTDNTVETYYIPEKLKKVTILGGKIYERAFYNCYNCSSLTNIIISEGVQTIEKEAFWFCPNLTSITISDGVTSIGQRAFYWCSNLTSITIPNSVTSIGQQAFEGCSNLTSVTIPDGVTTIEYDTFYNCSSLTSITIPSTVTSIGQSAFSNCTNLTSVNISVRSYGYSGFPAISIGESAFSSCTSLTSITIPDRVISIGKSAFYGCSNLKEAVFKVTTGWYSDSKCSNKIDGDKLLIPSEAAKMLLKYGSSFFRMNT